MQHLEEEEEEAEPPEKPLIKNQQLLSSPNRKTSSNQHQMEPLSRKFTILSKIGEGGYGNVYTVKKTGEHEKDSNQIYALKVSAKPIGHHKFQKYLDYLLDEFFCASVSRCRRIFRIFHYSHFAGFLLREDFQCFQNRRYNSQARKWIRSKGPDIRRLLDFLFSRLPFLKATSRYSF